MPDSLPSVTGNDLSNILGVVLTIYVPFFIKSINDLKGELKEIRAQFVLTQSVAEKRLTRLEAIVKVLWAIDQKRRKEEKKDA